LFRASLGVFGPAIIGILAAVAQQERVRLSERTKALGVNPALLVKRLKTQPKQL